MHAEKLNIAAIRQDFPALNQQVNGHPLVYFDNAATTQKPQAVIDALMHYYSHDNANVHRGLHELSERATKQYEAARCKVQQFINAPSEHECIFLRGTTEAVNLVAQSYVLPRLKAGDEVLITEMEHHSNIVPWQMICEKAAAVLKVVPINDRGELILSEFEALLNKKTKFFSVGHISNALGTINPIKKMIQMAHAQQVPVFIDGAQAAPHTKIDVQDLDCDFYAFSGHKMYGPTGIGVLYGKAELLEAMQPYQGGGEMITRVSFSGTQYNVIPHKFEAGTPNIAGVIGLSAAIDYLNQFDMSQVAAYEKQLLSYATEAIQSVKDIRLIGTAADKASILSFTMGKVHPHDIGSIVNDLGVAIRSGHHCAMPVMDHFKVAATARGSFAFYNTREEIDIFTAALGKVHEVFD
ncbi:MAG: cysteine desulfurase [Gammaproteobacteria bacterium]